VADGDNRVFGTDERDLKLSELVEE